MTWWWLSFCDTDRPSGEQLIGIAIVRAPDFIFAVMAANRTGCNPGGEVMGLPVPSEFGDPPDEWNHKLITDKARVDALTQQWHGCECKTIAELEAEELS